MTKRRRDRTATGKGAHQRRSGLRMVGEELGEAGEESSEAREQLAALSEALGTSVKDLGDSYEFLRLFGAVVGQITLLEVAVGSSDPKARASAGRALIKLDEEPSVIAERLRSSEFRHLDTEALREIVREIGEGKNPREALREAIARRKA